MVTIYSKQYVWRRGGAAVVVVLRMASRVTYSSIPYSHKHLTLLGVKNGVDMHKNPQYLASIEFKIFGGGIQHLPPHQQCPLDNKQY
jgi:hypothetical protein